MSFVSSQPYFKYITWTFHNTNQRTAVILVTAIFTLYLTVASEQHVNAQAIMAHELIRLARYEKTCLYTVSTGTYQAHSKMQTEKKCKYSNKAEEWQWTQFWGWCYQQSVIHLQWQVSVALLYHHPPTPPPIMQDHKKLSIQFNKNNTQERQQQQNSRNQNRVKSDVSTAERLNFLKGRQRLWTGSETTTQCQAETRY